MEEHLIRESDFTNITSGTLFYDGSDVSILLPDTTAHETLFGVSVGQVFQSPFREWIYQSGVALDGTNNNSPPVQHSGIYVQGAFRTQDDPIFGYTPDFINGRIIFNDPQSLDLQVNADFSYRGTRVNFEHQFNQQLDAGALEHKYSTNPFTNQHVIYPSGLIHFWPAIFIESDNRTLRPYELGNRSAIITDTIHLHIWALDDLQRDNLVDILAGQWRKVIPIIDFNMAPLPLSGIHNTLSPEYIPYQKLLRNNQIITTIGSGVPIRYLAYIDDVNVMNLPAVQEYERSRVTYNLTVYLNAPITPLGHKFGPITTLPTIQDIGF